MQPRLALQAWLTSRMLAALIREFRLVAQGVAHANPLLSPLYQA
jgi:hypothetical protein